MRGAKRAHSRQFLCRAGAGDAPLCRHTNVGKIEREEGDQGGVEGSLSFDKLSSLVKESFALDGSFVVSYQDADGDKVVVKDDDDLSLAIGDAAKGNECEQQGKQSDGEWVDEVVEAVSTLRLTVEQPSPSPPVPPYAFMEIIDTVAKSVVQGVNTLKDRALAPCYKGHPRHTCDGCEMFPIIGRRFHCEQLPDYDLCEQCHEKSSRAAESSKSDGKVVLTYQVFDGTPLVRKGGRLRRQQRPWQGTTRFRPYQPSQRQQANLGTMRSCVGPPPVPSPFHVEQSELEEAMTKSLRIQMSLIIQEAVALAAVRMKAKEVMESILKEVAKVHLTSEGATSISPAPSLAGCSDSEDWEVIEDERSEFESVSESESESESEYESGSESESESEYESESESESESEAELESLSKMLLQRYHTQISQLRHLGFVDRFGIGKCIEACENLTAMGVFVTTEKVVEELLGL